MIDDLIPLVTLVGLSLCVVAVLILVANMQKDDGGKQKTRKRHFIVCYHYVAPDGWGNGQFGISRDGYPPRLYLHDCMKKEMGYENLVITNIIELSKRDFDDYCSEAE